MKKLFLKFMTMFRRHDFSVNAQLVADLTDDEKLLGVTVVRCRRCKAVRTFRLLSLYEFKAINDERGCPGKVV